MDQLTLVRFMAKVNKTEDCWLWTASINRTGYGQFGIKKLNGMNTMVEVHRLSYLHHHGEIQKGLVVRHKCRNRHCVNPDHLEVGTKSDNAYDKVRDGTMIWGENHPYSLLTKEQVLDIRSRKGQLHREIAEEFGVDRRTISQIIAKTRWKYL